MSGKHLASLDGLRGLAILLVILYHGFPHRDAGILGYLASASWCGVDLFFVLSGFLITGILFNTQTTPNFYRNFYARRALRLFPIYILFLAVALISPHRPTGHPWWVTFFFASYAANIVLFFIPTFQFGLPLVTIHIWSLAVEEQFYLLWPWLVARLRTPRRIVLGALCGSAAALALRLLVAHLPLASSIFVYYELPTRADSLLIGAAAAMLYRTPGLLARHLPTIRIVGTLSALAYITIALHAHTFFFAAVPIDTWGYTLLALAAASILLLAVHPGSWTGRLFANPVLRFFGRYSYGLYLIYQMPDGFYMRYLWPILLDHLHSTFLVGIAYFALTLAFATALAFLSFNLFEKRFLTLKTAFQDRPSQRPTSSAALAS